MKAFCLSPFGQACFGRHNPRERIYKMTNSRMWVFFFSKVNTHVCAHTHAYRHKAIFKTALTDNSHNKTWPPEWKPHLCISCGVTLRSQAQKLAGMWQEVLEKQRTSYSCSVSPQIGQAPSCWWHLIGSPLHAGCP